MRFSILTFLALVAVHCGCSQKNEKKLAGPKGVLPAIDNIQAMSAESESEEIPKFEVPAELWPSLLAALSPADVDSDPAKWEVMGELHITETNGSRTLVNLYWGPSQGERGAFSAGPTFEERIYYRGGNSQELVNAIKAAYEKSMSTQKQNAEAAEHPQASGEAP